MRRQPLATDASPHEYGLGSVLCLPQAGVRNVLRVTADPGPPTTGHAALLVYIQRQSVIR
jgi:hypothetical protein